MNNAHVITWALFINSKVAKMKEEKCLKYLMILPLLVVLGGLIIYPLIKLTLLSFYSGSWGEQVFDLQNFRRFMKDAEFWNSVKVTFIFVITSVSIEFVIGLGLALLVSEVENVIARSILLFPMMTAPIAVGLIWRLMYHPMFGIINVFLQSVGLSPQGWLADRQLALPSVIIADIWQWSSFVYLVLLAGLKSIPTSPYEAAIMDGATGWQIFRYITLPLLKPTIYVALLFRSMGAFKVFGKLVTLTSGGPGQATEVLTLHIYKTSFNFLELGYGALLAIVSVVFIVIYNESYTRIFGLRRRG